MERLNTGADLLARAKRIFNVKGDIVLEEVFDIAFFVGMASFIEFMHETSLLEHPDSTEQLLEMEKEVDLYLDQKFPQRNDNG